ncbi:Mechanosensitive ion channel [Pseudomonas peli]|uniref:Mechanosensitive ion channel n=1 Tax=Pseudomonas peli TaxID=592361 RepID=A0AB37Z3W4_9PSED|nr:mechanosensitive ion channel domain-containing protein [Pseudomonas peli]SCW37757.1 Mechanosensitive ion channel [Pseudomonas peli]
MTALFVLARMARRFAVSGGRSLGHLLGLALSVLLVVSSALAQDESAPAAPTATTAAAIALNDILLRADDDQRLADRAKRRAASADPAAALGALLDDIARPVDEKLRAFSVDELRQLPFVRLESLARHWSFDAHRIQAWRTQMRAVTKPYADDTAELSLRRVRWQATRVATPADSMPVPLARQIDLMISELQAAEQALAAPLEQLIELGQRANAINSSIQLGREEVDRVISGVDARLFSRDSLPLWQALHVPDDQQADADSVVPGLDIEARFADAYSAVNAIKVHTMQALLVLLLLVLLWLARQQRLAPHVSRDDDSQRVAARPLSAWLLLAVMVVQVFESDAPMMALEVLTLLAVVPALRMLPQRAHDLLGSWPLMAAGLYLADRLGALLWGGEDFYRVFQLGLTVVALLLTLWLLRQMLRRAERSVGWARTMVRGAVWLGGGLLLASLLANLAGALLLTQTLTSGVIDSGYIGLLLYASMTLVNALLRMLTELPAVQRVWLFRRHGQALLSWLRRALLLAAAVSWLLYSMDRFRVLLPVQAFVSQVLGYDVEVGELSISLGDVLVFALSVLITIAAARATKLILREQLQGHSRLPRGVGNSIASLTYYALLLLGFLLALSAAGFKVSQLTLLFGALGVGIGFGLQGLVSNFVSGLVLMFERPIQPGDVIEINGASGSVREIGLRATKIRTFDGADIVVPNGTLVANNLTNWTLQDRNRRIEVPIGVAYGSDPAQVIELLASVARAVPGVAAEPAPVVLLQEYGDSSLNFSVRAWAQDYDRWTTTRSELMVSMLQALAASNISIPYNQYDLNLRGVPDELTEAMRQVGQGGGKLDAS